MAGASTSVYKFDNVVRGQHVYKNAWIPLTDKTCKCILREENERDKHTVIVWTIECISIQKEDAHIKRDIKNKPIFYNVWHYFSIYSIKFNNFGTRHLNGPKHLFYSFCCTTRHIFEPLRVYEPGFNTDKYGN